MKKFLLLSARRIGIPGLLTWVMFIGIYLCVRVPRNDWHWIDLAKYTAMTLVISYTLGSLETDNKKTPASIPVCRHDGDQVLINSDFGLHRWCMECGALKLPDESSWTLPRPTRRPT